MLIKQGTYCMKTKIIYISGNEVFNIADIRAAFEAVRGALQLDKDTVLFGVPVDTEDAGFGTVTTDAAVPVHGQPVETTQSDTETSNDSVEINEISSETITDEKTETIAPQDTIKPKRGRARKNKDTEQDSESVPNDVDTTNTETTNDVVPILTVLSAKDDEEDEKTTTESPESVDTDDVVVESAEPMADIPADIIDDTQSDTDTDNFVEPDLEKLLSEMTPLQEDVLEDNNNTDVLPEVTDDIQTDDVDATLEKLATEFAETQDKIASETKSSARSKIGRLRNILPFKQSKHKDQGLGDLFGWAGVAANDEEFSVPGFFTNAASKK